MDITRLDAIAAALNVDVPMLLAIADGQVWARGIIGDDGQGRQAILSTYGEWLRQRATADAPEEPRHLREARRVIRAQEMRLEGEPPPRAEIARDSGKPCVLYRLIGDAGRVLYVGVTRNPEQRIKRHRRVWGNVIVEIRTETFDNPRDMLDAEAAAIAAEDPPLNVAGITA